MHESDFQWALQKTNHLWAPDIQYRKADYTYSDDRIYLYVPDVDNSKNHVQRIGVAWSPASSDSLQLTFEPNYFTINGYDSTAYDPGIFYDDPNLAGNNASGNYYMAFCNTGYINPVKSSTIGLVQVNSDMKGGTYLGLITMQRDPGSDRTI